MKALFYIMSISFFTHNIIGCKPYNTNIEKTENQNNNSAYDSLYRIIECNDANFETQETSIRDSIKLISSNLQAALQNHIADTNRTSPLLEHLKNDSAFEKNLRDESLLIFWSYGVSSMSGERKVAMDCFYLKKLKERLFFLNAISDKINGALLNLPK